MRCNRRAVRRRHGSPCHPAGYHAIRVETRAPRSAGQRPDLELPLGTLREIVSDIRGEPALQKQLLKSLEELGRKARGALSATDWQLWTETGQTDEFTRLLGQAEQLLEAWVVEDEMQ